MPESDLDQLISPVYSRYTNPVTTILAAPETSRSTCARLCGRAEAEALLAEVGGGIEQLLATRIYSHAGDPLEKVVGDLLRARGATLAVAESCTGGLLAARLTACPAVRTTSSAVPGSTPTP